MMFLTGLETELAVSVGDHPIQNLVQSFSCNSGVSGGKLRGGEEDQLLLLLLLWISAALARLCT